MIQPRTDVRARSEFSMQGQVSFAHEPIAVAGYTVHPAADQCTNALTSGHLAMIASLTNSTRKNEQFYEGVHHNCYQQDRPRLVCSASVVFLSPSAKMRSARTPGVQERFWTFFNGGCGYCSAVCAREFTRSPESMIHCGTPSPHLPSTSNRACILPQSHLAINGSSLHTMRCVL